MDMGIRTRMRGTVKSFQPVHSKLLEKNSEVADNHLGMARFLIGSGVEIR